MNKNEKKQLVSLIDEKIIKNIPIEDKNKFILRRRINKLTKDPIGFLEGSYNKRSQQLKQKLPIKHNGNHDFTVVSAVYNVEKYLDDYFQSIVNQSLSFKKHIQIICVDDGSTDNSAKIIKNWQKKYPHNIHYYYKENGGQASARNIGIEYVNTEWVTFIDPDDFISENYFYELDNFVLSDAKLSLVGCPLVFYFDDKDEYKNTHPLKYRFNKGNQIFENKNLENNLQLSASTAIFKTSLIKNVRFDEEMRPSFEDAKFIQDFLLENINSKTGFVSNIKYFYRKRGDGDSTLDGAWLNPKLFDYVLEYGCLDILKRYQNKLGFVPEYIQRTVLYHIYWYFGRIINAEYTVSHLNNEQKEKFLQLISEVFQYIDNTTIEKFNIVGWFFHKVGFLGFKNEKPSSQFVYIEKYDLKKNQILISFFSHQNALYEILLDNKEVIPAYQKILQHKFLSKNFVKEYRIWVPVNVDNNLLIKINGKQAGLTLFGQRKNLISVAEIKQTYIDKSTVKNTDWVIMDKDDRADDNAEHLYRYIKNNHLKENVYFALKKSSDDWQRLENEGFNLLDYGSKAFENKFEYCDKIISSHIDGYITHYFKDDRLMDKDFIFLQHGVTKDDLSQWLNTKKNMRLFVTATNDEYNSIIDNNSKYKFTEKEVLLSGFPRYDNLLLNNKQESKIILIMPTWRNNIVGATLVGQGTNTRTKNPTFMQTDYAQAWSKLLQNEFVKKIVQEEDYQVIFAPHPNIQPYLDDFQVPSYITIYKYSQGNIQALFQQAKMLITDYSSVAFDVAYLNKQVLYYQFDYDKIFSGTHTYQKGYFSYEKDGFGKVVYDEQSLLNELERMVKNGCELVEPYKTRIKNTFPFRDGKNCERVYQAIVDLDKPDNNSLNIDILQEFIEQAKTVDNWNLLEQRSFQMLDYINSHNDSQFNKYDYQQDYLNALYKQCKYAEMAEYLANHDVDNKAYWQAKVQLQTGFEPQALAYFEKNTPNNIEEILVLLLTIVAKYQDKVTFKNQLVQLLLNFEEQISENQEKILQVIKIIAENDLEMSLEAIDDLLIILTEKEKQIYKLELIASYLCLQNNELILANKYLVEYEKHTINDISCRILIIQLADKNGNNDKVITQYKKAFVSKYINVAHDIRVNYLVAKEKWQDIIDLISTNEELQKNNYYEHTLAYYRLGKFDNFAQTTPKPSDSDDYRYWQLISEIALINDDFDLLEYCLKGMIVLFPNNDNNALKNQLILLKK
ncbi:MAG: CDP-glycerol glycerophosphotransferase family protein [Moraxellaceae bacterium]|nr:CDP-glycerol glycerophosphotransferase family protein [Moraxellaceae bacterium]